MDLKKYIVNVPNFPIEGIQFKDITPLMQDGKAFRYACEKMASFAKENNATIIVGPEARGFLFGCPVAALLDLGFAPVRKPNKLPRETESVTYSLEYGTNTLSMHKDAIKKGDKVVIIDDLLATGGTTEATIKLINRLGGEVVGIAFLIELVDLKGRELLKNYNVLSLLQY